MNDFGLDDWPQGGVSRKHAIHVAYSRAVRRAGGQLQAYVSVLDVARRDGWACSECGEPVPQHWTADELGRAPVLAFTVPLAEGGRYTEDGVRLAHLRCTRFADAALEVALRRTGQACPRSRRRPAARTRTASTTTSWRVTTC